MAISKYTRPIEQSLEQYIPLPFEAMAQAGQAIQARGDLAEQQQMAVETGLGSMEALAPGYSQFRDKFVTDYKTQAAGLLDKFGGNTSDPEFIRASKKLNLTFAADPRLQTIKQGNELIKSQQKIAQELGARGTKFIDPNRGFTGVDPNTGKLTVPQGSIRGTNFDEDLTKSFLQIRDNMIDNGRGWKTNKPNLDRLAGNLVSNLETNPVTRDAIDYYKQQGLSDADARKATQGLIRQAYTDNLRTDKDWAYENYQLALSRAKAADAVPLPKTASLLDDKTPVEEQANPFKLKVTTVDKILSGLNDKGGLKKDTFTVEDTPENRSKYKGQFRQQVTTTGGSGMGYSGGTPVNELVVNGSYNKEHIALLKEAREALGGAAKNGDNYLSDKNVLTKYKEALASTAKDFRPQLTYDKKLNNLMQDIFVGNNGERADQIYTIKEGGLKEIDRSELKDFRYQGITTSPTDLLPDGFMKVTARDKSGKINTFAMPIPDDIKAKTIASSALYNYINTGKIDYNKVPAVKGSNGQTLDGYFADPNTGYIYKPYRRYENGKFGVGATIYDPTGKKIGTKPLSVIEKQDITNLYNFVGLNNE